MDRNIYGIKDLHRGSFLPPDGREGHTTSAQKPSWIRWGLSIAGATYKSPGELKLATRIHDLVDNYLRNHPKAAEKYDPGQGGELKYFDILALAEKEDKRVPLDTKPNCFRDLSKRPVPRKHPKCFRLCGHYQKCIDTGEY